MADKPDHTIQVDIPVYIPETTVADLLERGFGGYFQTWGKIRDARISAAVNIREPHHKRPPYIAACFSSSRDDDVRIELNHGCPETARPFWGDIEIDYDRVSRALQQLHDLHPDSFAELRAGHPSQRVADEFIQLCAFRRIVFPVVPEQEPA